MIEIDEIQKIRVENNKLWMDLLRIAMNKDPENTKRILKEIRKNDLLVSDKFDILANSNET